jgi:aspartate carbamoyltransferase catalytic subunit
MKLQHKHILGISDMTEDEIFLILDTAKNMKLVLDSKNKRTPYLQGKSIITLFYENSTRTRLSFELASKYMGASSANISASGSSVAKGESLIDTAKTINMMGADVIIIRHPMAGAPHLIAANVDASVINAGDGMNEHPTQALLDFMTIREKKGTFRDLKVTLTGDIMHSRVAKSNIFGLVKLGAKVTVAGPSTLIPRGIEKMGVNVSNSIRDAVKDADVVMGLRIQTERQKSGLYPSIREYAKLFSVDDKVLKLAKPDVLLLHPGPVNRGVELTSAVIDGPASLINEQVANGVAVRMALLFLLTRREANEITD